MTEEQLIEACIRRDRNAQRVLYERYQRAMYTLAYRVTGNFETAAEALQDAFLQIFNHIDGFRKESSLGAWIKTIVTRCAISQVRKRRMFFEEIDNRPEETTDHFGTAIDVEYLEKAILSLPDGYRTVFILAEVEGYKHHEIAEMLGINEGTSKSQLFYAKKRLQHLLVNYC